jgi:hypothetical protein
LAKEIWTRLTRRIGSRAQNVSKLSWGETITYFRLRLKVLANVCALKYYCPRPYSGSFHLFLTKESITAGIRPRWCNFVAGKSKIHDIPGTHRSVTGDMVEIEENQMKALGEKLRACIDDTLGDDQGG